MNSEKVQDNDKLIQQVKLELVLKQVLDVLQNGRGTMYDIAEECHGQCAALRTRLEKVSLEAGLLVEKVDRCEELEKAARIRLMEVSRNFRRFSEADIKDAYEKAQSFQNELLTLRQKELYLRKQRDELSIQLRQLEGIAEKASGYLKSSNLALRVLKNNVAQVSETLEEARRKQQIGVWMVESLEAERRKIARELHDGPAQNVASMLIRLSLIDYLFQEDMEQARQELVNIKEMGREGLSDLRRIMFDLKPSPILEMGLVAALREYFQDYERKYNFVVDFRILGEERKYDYSLETTLFRLIQEAISNARKHARVSRALVKMENRQEGLTLLIQDEGCGFDPTAASSSEQDSYGILGMSERAALLGGKMRIISAPGSGTQVIVELPVGGELKSG